MVSLHSYLLVSGILFAVGLSGVLIRRNVIVIFMCLELMLTAANLSLVAFSRFHLVDGVPDFHSQSLVFFVITVAAAEVAVGLAIIVAVFRVRQTTDVTQLDRLRS